MHLDISTVLRHRTELSEEDTRLAKYFAIYFPHANSKARRSSNAKATPPSTTAANFDKVIFSDGSSNNVESSEQVFEIPDTPLDYTDMENALMNPLTGVNSGKTHLTLNSVYNVDQDLQLELDRSSDDYQPFSYLAF